MIAPVSVGGFWIRTSHIPRLHYIYSLLVGCSGPEQLSFLITCRGADKILQCIEFGPWARVSKPLGYSIS